MSLLSQEMSSGAARLRFDIHGSQPSAHVLDAMTFLNYRLAEVRLETGVTLPRADVVWYQDEDSKQASYTDDSLILRGVFFQGEIQKILVSMMALRMEDAGLHPFHASAVRYRNLTIMFLGGESNHGKSMAQIEGCRRGGLVVSTETTVTDERGWAVMGSKSVFLRQRSKGTERADKLDQDQGVAKFFDQTPEFVNYDEPSDVNLVILPSIDGHFDTAVVEMIPFERNYQTYHSLMNYLGVHEVLAPGLPMPLLDSDERRAKRAASASGLRNVSTFSSAPRHPGFCSTNWKGCCKGGRPRLQSFRYARPDRLDEALALLDEYGPGASVLAGGTDLLVRLRMGHALPRIVIDLKRVTALSSRIVESESHLRIGALAVMADLIEDERVRRHFPALIEAAGTVGSVQIRNRATLAGNICNASPAADTVPALLVYGAVANLTGLAGSRSVPVTEFFIGPGRTVLNRGEIVESIDLPLGTERSGSAFARLTRRRGVDLASVNLCCLVNLSGETRFAYGAVGPRPFLVQDASGVLTDPLGDPREKEAALQRLIAKASPITDLRASREYRLAMLMVLSRRALETAIDRLNTAKARA